MPKNQVKLGPPDKVFKTILNCRPEDITETVIVTPFIPLKSFRRHMDEGSVRELNPRYFFSGLRGNFGGRPITVVLTGVGPSRIGDMVAFLSLTKARRVIFAGAVGALNQKWSLGDYFAANKAIDGEGFARYCREDFESLVNNSVSVDCRTPEAERLTRFLRNKGKTVRESDVFTIGSIAFESKENLELLRDAGIEALEMELSAFFSSAQRHGLDACALTYVSDLPLSHPFWGEMGERETALLTAAWWELPALCMEYGTDR